MTDYVTRSGLVVRDGRSERGLPPRDNPPNGNVPGVNPPPNTANPPGFYDPISVGPDASEGWGNSHVLYPAGDYGIQAWSGWPTGWQTPTGNGSGWFGGISGLVDLVFACLDLNSSVLSTMPPYVVKDDIRQPEPMWIANPEPLVYNAWTDFAKELFWCYQAVGEVFILKTATFADTGFPRRFMVVDPAYVNVELVDGIRRYEMFGNDITSDVLHIKYASWPGDLRGHGPLEVAGARILAAEALTRYATDLASRGGIPWAVLSTPAGPPEPR